MAKRRNTKTKILILAVLFLFFSSPVVFATRNKNFKFQWMQFYRYDTRHEHDQLYVNRISITFDYLDKKEKSLFKLAPFYEIRRNLNNDLWERQELGIEIGKDIASWFYLGEAIQEVWLKEGYRQYPAHKRRDTTELETRLLFSKNILSNAHISVKGFVLGEYTYDFKRGAGTRNEITIGFVVPVGKYLETGLDWRHIDRIHDFDSDTFEASATLVF